MSAFFKSLFVLCLMALLWGCALGPLGSSQTFARNLSRNDPYFRTCVFNPLTRVAHFPMWHFPYGGHYTCEEREQVIRSQFQLLHTVVDYKRSRQVFLFDEHIAASDGLNEEFYKRISEMSQDDPQKGEFFWTRAADNQPFYYKDQMNRATQAFSSGWPLYYENLSPRQQDILFNIGAGMTLYLTGQVPKLYKVINESGYNQVRDRMRGAMNPSLLLASTGRDPWIFDFREEALGQEVRALRAQNPAPYSLFLIAYGADHDFSTVFAPEKAQGHFESGRNSCDLWAARAQTFCSGGP